MSSTTARSSRRGPSSRPSATRSKAWIDTLLGEVERQSDGRWDLRQIRRPRSWFIASEFHDIPEKLLPAIHVESAAKDLDHTDRPGRTASFPMVVQGVVKAGGQVQHVNGPQSLEMVRELNAAFEGRAPGSWTTRATWAASHAARRSDGARYDLIPPERDRTLSASRSRSSSPSPRCTRAAAAPRRRMIPPRRRCRRRRRMTRRPVST
jgi:hypothetical protein